MSNKSNNGTNKVASNKGSRKGPRPIMTVAMLREKMLKELMVKELKKIESKYNRLLRRKQMLAHKLHTVDTQLDGLRELRVEYTAEVNR